MITYAFAIKLTNMQIYRTTYIKQFVLRSGVGWWSITGGVMTRELVTGMAKIKRWGCILQLWPTNA